MGPGRIDPGRGAETGCEGVWRVELHGQGYADEVEAFLSDILQSNRGSFIRDHEVWSTAVEPGLRSFSLVRA